MCLCVGACLRVLVYMHNAVIHKQSCSSVSRRHVEPVDEMFKAGIIGIFVTGCGIFFTCMVCVCVCT